MAELEKVKSIMFAILKDKGPLSLHKFVTEYEKRTQARLPFLQFGCGTPLRFVYFLKDFLKFVDEKVLLVSENPPTGEDPREGSVFSPSESAERANKTHERVQNPQELKKCVPYEIERNFERLAKGHPDGIYEEDFLPMYGKLYGTEVDHTEFGFDSAFKMLLSCRSIVIERVDKRFVVYPEIVHKRALGPDEVQQTIPVEDINVSFQWKDSFTNSECDPNFKFSPPQLPEDWALVEIIDAYSPTDFWIRTKNNEDRQNNLMDELNEYYTKEDDRHDLQDFVCPGLAVVGYFRDEWHRAVINSITDNNRMELFFVDYGTTVSNIKRSQVKKLHQKFARDEMLALKATMWNVKPPNGTSEWSMESHTYVYQEWGYITVRMKIIKVDNAIPQVEGIFFSDKSSKYTNYFTKCYPDKIFNVNELLVEEKLGDWIVSPDPEELRRYLGSASFHQTMKSRSVVEPVTSSTNEITDKPLETSANKLIDEPQATREIAEGPAPLDKSFKPFAPVLQEPLERFDENLPQPIAIFYETLSVDVTVPRPQPKDDIIHENSDLLEPVAIFKNTGASKGRRHVPSNENFDRHENNLAVIVQHLRNI